MDSTRTTTPRFRQSQRPAVLMSPGMTTRLDTVDGEPPRPVERRLPICPVVLVLGWPCPRPAVPRAITMRPPQVMAPSNIPTDRADPHPARMRALASSVRLLSRPTTVSPTSVADHPTRLPPIQLPIGQKHPTRATCRHPIPRRLFMRITRITMKCMPRTGLMGTVLMGDLLNR